MQSLSAPGSDRVNTERQMFGLMHFFGLLLEGEICLMIERFMLMVMMVGVEESERREEEGTPA